MSRRGPLRRIDCVTTLLSLVEALARDPDTRARRDEVVAIAPSLTSIGACMHAAGRLAEVSKAEAEAKIERLKEEERLAIEQLKAAERERQQLEEELKSLERDEKALEEEEAECVVVVSMRAVSGH